METVEIYSIFRNGVLFAYFEEGDTSSYGDPFNREIAIREFDDCVDYYKGNGSESEWKFMVEIISKEKYNSPEEKMARDIVKKSIKGKDRGSLSDDIAKRIAEAFLLIRYSGYPDGQKILIENDEAVKEIKEVIEKLMDERKQR